MLAPCPSLFSLASGAGPYGLARVIPTWGCASGQVGKIVSLSFPRACLPVLMCRLSEVLTMMN